MYSNTKRFKYLKAVLYTQDRSFVLLMQFTFLLASQVMRMMRQQNALQTSKPFKQINQTTRLSNITEKYISEEIDGNIFPSWKFKTRGEKQG